MFKKILIVEDDVNLAKALSISLAEEGFKVSIAYDGLEGLSLAEKHQPALILCDINMPKMDGLTMLAELRKNDWAKNIEVIMLTNYSDQQNISQALKHKAFNYLVKSDWNLEQIVEQVKKKLVI
ncbi:MAG: response regulator [Clostridia bacterium]|nr:response regulator [Clostridia bacterium]